MVSLIDAGRAVRFGDTVYSDPLITDGSDRTYPAGTVLVTVTYDDGDRFVTKASRVVREALGINDVAADATADAAIWKRVRS